MAERHNRVFRDFSKARRSPILGRFARRASATETALPSPPARSRLLALAALAWLTACGSTVTISDPGGGAGASSAGDTGDTADLDPQCYEACIAKGVTAAACGEACDGFADGEAKAGSKAGSSGSSSGSTGSGSVGGSSSTGGYDPAVQKSCVQCWNEEGSDECGAELKACETDLACTTLRNCPWGCDKGVACVDECNAIVPAGVAPLSALVQCAACEAGPCQQECLGTSFLAYCE